MRITPVLLHPFLLTHAADQQLPLLQSLHPLLIQSIHDQATDGPTPDRIGDGLDERHHHGLSQAQRTEKENALHNYRSHRNVGREQSRVS